MSVLRALAVLVLGLLPSTTEGADAYVEILGDGVPILASSEAKAALIGHARKGDIFQLAGKKGSLYELYLFSGEARYVAAAKAKPVTHTPSPPAELRRRREIFNAFVRAEDRAMADADKKYPPTPIERYVRYQRILDDRYKLEVVRTFEVQPVVYRPIKIEGAKARWR